MTSLTLPHEWMAMGLLIISGGNSAHKAGDNDAPKDRVEKQPEADAAEGEYRRPELGRTKTITAVYQRLIIAGRTLYSGHSGKRRASSSQLSSYHPAIPAG
jgi:hypothetical protein